MNRKALKEINNRVEDQTPAKHQATLEMYNLRSTRSMTKGLKREAIDEVKETKKSVKRLKSVAVKSEDAANNENENQSKVPVSGVDYVERKEEPLPEFSKNITQILGKHYFDVKTRLNLDNTPECLYDMDKCISRHNDERQLHILDDDVAKEFSSCILDGNIEMFYKFVTGTIMKGQFPGEILLQLVLESMLSINQSQEDHEFDNLLEYGEVIFLQVMKKFPPCWSKTKSKYLNVLTQKMHMKSSPGNANYECKDGIFKFLITSLEQNIKHTDKDNEAHKHSMDINDMNFATWEEHDKPTFDFAKNSREVQLKRTFIILNLIVKLLEDDLAIWILKHPRHIRATFKCDEKKPLIASLFWTGNKECEVNSEIRRVIEIFVNCVYLNYPSDDLNVLSRLLNLIATCINICELPTIKEKTSFIQYPSINEKSELFVKELKRTIDDSPHFSLSLYVKILNTLRTPYVIMLLSDQMLNRVSPQLSRDAMKYGKFSVMNKILATFNTKIWCTMKTRDEMDVSMNSTHFVEKYPVLPLKPTRKKAFEVFQEDFLSILLSHLKSYMEIYRLHNLFNSIKSPAASQNIIQGKKQEKFNGFNIKMLQNLVSNIPHATPSSDTSTPKAEIFNFVCKSIVVDSELMMSYREQMKFCYHMQRYVNERIQKYPELQDIKKYLNSILVN
uniref:CSON000208 protein n=1 Tax=Culicoides sonorensis TaxID=179676 RepID=A0A336K8C2_CULSO